MKRRTEVAGFSAVVIAMAFVLVSCGGGGGGSTPTCTTCSNVAGTWSTLPNHEIVHAGNCGSGTYTDGATYVAAQNGCNLTVTTSGNSFTGQICNDTISWSGSYPENGGTTTLTSASFTLSGNTFTGTANWTWTGTSSSCSGYTEVTATKQ